MRIVLSWLRELVPVELPVEELSALLALKGAHLESVERPWEGLNRVVVARVLEVRDHPNSDTLPYRGTSAGGGCSTVEDFARFADALLNHELLSPDSTELLITGKEEIAPGVSYAYGFEDHRDAGGNGWVGHGGGAPGMNGDLRIYPKSGYVVVVLANLDPPASLRVADYLDARLPLDE